MTSSQAVANRISEQLHSAGIDARVSADGYLIDLLLPRPTRAALYAAELVAMVHRDHYAVCIHGRFSAEVH